MEAHRVGFENGSASLLASLNRLAGQVSAQTKRHQAVSDSHRRTFEQVEIEVGVEVGELLLSVADLLDLAPGNRFSVRFPDEAPVTLRVGGEPIGFARLDAEGEQLFLTVTSLSPEGESFLEK